jgi:hypothetical protein
MILYPFNKFPLFNFFFNMKIKSELFHVFLLLFLLGNLSVYGQSTEEALKTINENSIKGQLNFLASNWMEGRESETKGAYLAGDYIASVFQIFGIEPYGDMEYSFPLTGKEIAKPEAKPSYFQKFNIIKYKPSKDQSFSLIYETNGARVTKNFNYTIDYDISGIEIDTQIDAPVVFVGYGIKNDLLKYNDYAGVNVKGKIILRLEGFPGFRDTTSSSYKKLKFSNLWNDKERWAVEAGAVGIINISSYSNKDFGKPGNLPVRNENGEFENNYSQDSFYDKKAVIAIDPIHKSLPVIRISDRLQHELMSIIKVDCHSFEQDIKNNLKSFSKEINSLRIGLKSGVESELMSVRNVVGMIEGENKDEFIIVGAHYDHLGKYNGRIFNGADDNGSGTIGVMSVARAMKATGKKPLKTIIFAAWTAEEKGLLGSRYFSDNFIKTNRILLNLNFDMIGRSSVKDSVGNKCKINYTKAYGGFQKISENNIKEYGLDLDINYTSSDKPSGGSDYSPFAEKDIPVICFMAAMHPDYHKPTDEVFKIEWKKMEHIIKLGFLNTYEIANSDMKTYKFPLRAEE